MTWAVRITPEIDAALAEGRPVVALETSVIAQGLPAQVGPAAWVSWEAAIREEGAVPATIAVIGGCPVVGVSAEEIAHLADGARGVLKAARRDLGLLAASGADGGTTVSATLAIAHRVGIRVAATGGIGGVHRDFTRIPDESADLRALAELPVALFCSGAKAVLDLPATLERLETWSVPVIGYGTSFFPAFYTEAAHESDALRLEWRFDDPRLLARALATHFALDGGGAVVAVAPMGVAGLTAGAVERAVADAVAEASTRGVRGKALTPFLLADVAKRTGGLSLAANLTLLEKNARAAARVAVAWPTRTN